MNGVCIQVKSGKKCVLVTVHIGVSKPHQFPSHCALKISSYVTNLTAALCAAAAHRRPDETLTLIS